MEDADIIDLYWSRNEQAIHETDKKYRFYCLSVSENILRDRQAQRSASTTHGLEHGMPYRLIVQFI